MDADDVDFIDQYATEHAVASRSAVMQKAVALLRAVELGEDYAAAWDEWSRADDADLWHATVNDGLDK